MKLLTANNTKMAIHAVQQSHWRSLLTMLGVIIGIASVVTIVGLGEGIKHQIVGQINNLGNNLITVGLAALRLTLLPARLVF